MTQPLTATPPSAIITGWDFSTGAVKCLAFSTAGDVLAEARFGTDLHTSDGVSELNLLLLEGQARATTRAIAAQLKEQNRLHDWLAGGISATHHTAGLVDDVGNPLRRAICWNDQTLAKYHLIGQNRLGGPERVREFIGGPWAERYTLSHIVKDFEHDAGAWAKVRFMLSHGSLALADLTGRWGVTSISSAASTGIMDLRSNRWRTEMLGALREQSQRECVLAKLPSIQTDDAPVAALSENLALECALPAGVRPLVFPTLDDQAAGLVGGGATEPGHVAIILGNSAVVNSSADFIPEKTLLDVMKLNHGPFLWMRCYSNGAQFLDRVLGGKPDWAALEKAARAVAAGCHGVSVMPFALSEPSVGVSSPRVEWSPAEPTDAGVRFRAALEAIAYLIALAVAEHETAGQKVSRVSVSGGIAKSDLMVEILASALDKPLERLASDEGPALGAAAAALAGLESHRRRAKGDASPFRVADAVQQMVKFKGRVPPNREWVSAYQKGLASFRMAIMVRG
jgi:MYXO-CTERM domain-containing protein